MAPIFNSWLSDEDLEGILVSQTILIKAQLASTSVVQTVSIPRYLLDKNFNLFEDKFRVQDFTDPTRSSPVIKINLADWYNEYGLENLEAEWQMLKVFFKWLFCGRLIGELNSDVSRLPWGDYYPAAFVKAVSHHIERDESPNSEIFHMSPI